MDNVILNLILISGAHGLLISMVLFLHKKNKKANRFFSLFVLVVSIGFFNLYGFRIESDSIICLLIGIIPGFLIGPLIYLYVRTSLSGTVRFQVLFHFIPAVLSMVIYNYIPPQFYILLEDLQTLSYLTGAMIIQYGFRIRLTQIFSSLDKLKFKWLAFLLIILTIFRLYSLVEIILFIRGIRIPEMIDNMSLIVESLFIYMISYILLTRKEVFDDLKNMEEQKTNNTLKDPEPKDRISGMLYKRWINMLDIAFQSGFNSKSSFNEVFKKFTRMTPTQYMKKHSESSLPFHFQSR